MLSYDELSIRITPSSIAGSYAVVAWGAAGDESAEFSVPFQDLEVDNFVLRVGRTRRSARRLESPEMAHAKEFGGRLFDALFRDRVRDIYRRSREMATDAGKGIRISLKLSGAPELLNLPWEYLFDDPNFLSISTQTPIVRYLDLPARHRPLAVEPPLRILGMVSNPEASVPLAVDEECNRLETALAPLQEEGLVEVRWSEQPTLKALQRQLRKAPYHVFHFIGHGGFDEASQDGLLLLEDEHHRSRPVSGWQLGTILRDHTSLRLAVLNACEGARSATQDPFAGVASSLVQREIPAVIAMQFEITDRAAVIFGEELYAALVHSYPVDAALAEARKAIFANGNDIEWGTPTLFMRVPDGRIFTVQQPGPASSEPAEQQADTPPASTVGEADAVVDDQPPEPQPRETESDVRSVTTAHAGLPTSPSIPADDAHSAPADTERWGAEPSIRGTRVIDLISGIEGGIVPILGAVFTVGAAVLVFLSLFVLDFVSSGGIGFGLFEAQANLANPFALESYAIFGSVLALPLLAWAVISTLRLTPVARAAVLAVGITLAILLAAAWGLKPLLVLAISVVAVVSARRLAPNRHLSEAPILAIAASLFLIWHVLAIISSHDFGFETRAAGGAIIGVIGYAGLIVGQLLSRPIAPLWVLGGTASVAAVTIALIVVLAPGDDLSTLTTVEAYEVAFSPDATMLASGHDNGTVHWLDLGNGAGGAFATGHTHRVGVLTLSSEGALVATQSWFDPIVRLHELGSRGEQYRPLLPDGAVTSLAFSPDGTLLATGGEEGVQLWDVASGDEQTGPEEHTGAVTSLAFSPDGAVLATVRRGSESMGTVQLWDVASGEEQTLSPFHARGVQAMAVAFSPDGALLATGGHEGVRLWDVARGETIRP